MPDRTFDWAEAGYPTRTKRVFTPELVFWPVSGPSRWLVKDNNWSRIILAAAYGRASLPSIKATY